LAVSGSIEPPGVGFAASASSVAAAPRGDPVGAHIPQVVRN
jgi:hypothetical protein